MKARELELSDIVDFSDGNLSLQGRRVVLHSMDAFALLRHELIDSVGLAEARRILTRYGYFWGQADAAAMKRIFEWESLTEWIKAGPRMHSLQGATKVVTKAFSIDEAAGTLSMAVTWRDSVDAQQHLLEFGKADKPVCWMLAGYASGYASFCLGKEVYFLEDKCKAKGDRVCSAIGKDKDSWGDEISEHLPYFRADDIRGKVQILTKELKEKSRTFARQQERSARLRRAGSCASIEVRSESFRRVLDLATRVAGYDSSVLITGESGVGKEVLGRCIHNLSHRSDGPFVGVNCVALPETLLESELFGHKRGAFTGAIEDRIGLFEKAQKGTIFLDEIGDISLTMQMKLLRVLQEREIMRVGESETRKVDIRVITTTNRNLKKAVSDGSFREDLFYRLGVIEIEVPPLRERREDILALTRYFVKQVSEQFNLPKLHLDASCLDPLLSYSWPGNVRELENAIERAAVLCEDACIRSKDLPPSVLNATELNNWCQDQTLEEVEQHHIQAVLKATSNNRTKAAQILGISPTTLWRKLKND